MRYILMAAALLTSTAAYATGNPNPNNPNLQTGGNGKGNNGCGNGNSGNDGKGCMKPGKPPKGIPADPDWTKPPKPNKPAKPHKPGKGGNGGAGGNGGQGGAGGAGGHGYGGAGGHGYGGAGGNASSTSKASAAARAAAIAAQQQGQAQGQHQTANGGSASSDNAVNVIDYGDRHRRNPVSSAIAPSFGTEGCMGSRSIGAQGMVVGISGGWTKYDTTCEAFRGADYELRCALLVETSRAYRKALKRLGRTCRVQTPVFYAPRGPIPADPAWTMPKYERNARRGERG